MVIKRMTLLVLTSLMFAVSSMAKAQSPLAVKSFTLNNGMTVWLNIDHTQPKIYGAVVVKAGAKDCPNAGIAHYLEHLLFKGTQKIGTVDYVAEKPWLDSISAQYDLLARTTDAAERKAIQRHINVLSLKAADYAIPNEFNNLISLYGGTGLNAYTSFDETVFHNTFSPQYLRQWCELNSERLRDPVFRLFQGELEAVYEEKNMYADNLIASVGEKLQQYALAGTPYAYPIIGATDSLKNPRLSEMMRFYRKYYVPENMGLMLVGSIPVKDNDGDGNGISVDSLKTILESTFGRLQPTDNAATTGNNRNDSFHLRDFRSSPAFKLKVPIPIVKAGGYLWQAPGDHSQDYAAFKVMTSLLANEDETGLIDSLSNSGKLLIAGGYGYDFKDFSAWGFGFVPKIFGSSKKAARLCFEQIDKVRNGQFSDATLEAEKLSIRRGMETSLETISDRSKAMIDAFSHGLSWNDVTDLSNRVAAVTREDVMRVARKYLNDDSLKVEKKFGSYPKEHVSQPGYKPVKPVNAGKQSAYARQLAAMPVDSIEPKIIDVNNDAKRTVLSPLVNLYTVCNPENDVFTLKIIYHRGTRNDNRIGTLGSYLNDIGTERHDKHSFGQQLRRHGAALSADASKDALTLTLTGFDSHFEEAVALLHEFIMQPKADEKKFDDLVQTSKLEEKTFFKNNMNIAKAALWKVAKGNQSDYLTQLSLKELKKLSGKQLIELFKQLQHWQTDIVYCGRLDAKDVEKNVKSCINVGLVTKAWEPVKQQFNSVDDNTVYVYNVPSARQTIVCTYQQMVPLPTIADRTRLMLWGNYFGSGMQSVMFQEVREFRSLAYYAEGSPVTPNRRLQPDSPCGYITVVGTQGDKTMQAIAVVDSLLSDMPLRQNNVAAAKQSIVNGINNGYPSFRGLGSSVASLRLLGYDHDPNKDLLAVLPQLGISDVENFYKQNIQGRRHAVIVVGNKKMLDMKKLAKMGKVVKMNKSDIYKL